MSTRENAEIRGLWASTSAKCGTSAIPGLPNWRGKPRYTGPYFSAFIRKNFTAKQRMHHSPRRRCGGGAGRDGCIVHLIWFRIEHPALLQVTGFASLRDLVSMRNSVKCRHTLTAKTMRV